MSVCCCVILLLLVIIVVPFLPMSVVFLFVFSSCSSRCWVSTAFSRATVRTNWPSHTSPTPPFSLSPSRTLPNLNPKWTLACRLEIGTFCYIFSVIFLIVFVFWVVVFLCVCVLSSIVFVLCLSRHFLYFSGLSLNRHLYYFCTLRFSSWSKTHRRQYFLTLLFSSL